MLRPVPTADTPEKSCLRKGRAKHDLFLHYIYVKGVAMTPEEYLKQIKVFSNRHHELTWFTAEVAYYAAAGRVLDSLKGHLRLGCGIDNGKILCELGWLLKSLVELCACTMSHGEFLMHNWSSSREMVPAGVNGCANGILNMIRAGETGRRVHFLANACSHLGFDFGAVALQNLEDLKNENGAVK